MVEAHFGRYTRLAVIEAEIEAGRLTSELTWR